MQVLDLACGEGRHSLASATLGASAEYQAAGGGVLNVVGKTGTNAFHGDLASAMLGAHVTGVDRDETRLATARELAEAQGLSVDWRVVDLQGPWPELGDFDAVLVFNYLDRARMPEVQHLVAPGGLLMMESFLTGQRELGWGPTSEEHLLRPGELARLAAPLRILHGRHAHQHETQRGEHHAHPDDPSDP